MRQLKLLTVLQLIFFCCLLSFSISARAEYYFVYEPQYEYSSCGYGYSCAAVCDPCGYAYYETYSSPRYYYVERSYAQMNEYAWIP